MGKMRSGGPTRRAGGKGMYTGQDDYEPSIVEARAAQSDKTWEAHIEEHGDPGISAYYKAKEWGKGLSSKTMGGSGSWGRGAGGPRSKSRMMSSLEMERRQKRSGQDDAVTGKGGKSRTSYHTIEGAGPRGGDIRYKKSSKGQILAENARINAFDRMRAKEDESFLDMNREGRGGPGSLRGRKGKSGQDDSMLGGTSGRPGGHAGFGQER